MICKVWTLSFPTPCLAYYCDLLIRVYSKMNFRDFQANLVTGAPFPPQMSHFVRWILASTKYFSSYISGSKHWIKNPPREVFNINLKYCFLALSCFGDVCRGCPDPDSEKQVFFGLFVQQVLYFSIICCFFATFVVFCNISIFYFLNYVLNFVRC